MEVSIIQRAQKPEGTTELLEGEGGAKEPDGQIKAREKPRGSTPDFSQPQVPKEEGW